VRERGVQARRARAENDPGRPPSPSPSGLRFWQVLAVVALIAATAGWTTVAVIALRPESSPVAAVPPSEEPLPSDDASLEPAAESHEVVELEGLLPAGLNGTNLTRESWTGDTILGDDSWSTSLTGFLTKASKTASDLQASQAYDPAGSLDLSAGAFRVAGVKAADLRDAMIAAWKGDYPDLKTATTTIGGLHVTTGDFGDGGINSYWYVRGDVVFDIETGDAAIAQAALAALPVPGASAGPSSSAPASSTPGASASPS
jgi:hypothetical protein